MDFNGMHRQPLIPPTTITHSGSQLNSPELSVFASSKKWLKLGSKVFGKWQKFILEKQ